MAKKVPPPKVPRAPSPFDPTEAKPVLIPLELAARNHLKSLLEDPIFRIAWANASVHKPSVFVGGLNDKRGAQVANNRLHELRGWTLFATALLRQTEDPKPKTPAPQETFPDSGLPGINP